MKKRLPVLVFIIILLTVSCASAATPFDADSFFIADTSVLSSHPSWNRDMQVGEDSVIITETARIHGTDCQVVFYGSRYDITRITVSVPFSRLYMDEMAIFSDELFVYNAAYCALMDMDVIPSSSELFNIFMPYDLEVVLANGYEDDYQDLGGGWEWVIRKPGHLKIRKTDEYGYMSTGEGRILDNGMAWFDFTVNVPAR